MSDIKPEEFMARTIAVLSETEAKLGELARIALLECDQVLPDQGDGHNASRCGNCPGIVRICKT